MIITVPNVLPTAQSPSDNLCLLLMHVAFHKGCCVSHRGMQYGWPGGVSL